MIPFPTREDILRNCWIPAKIHRPPAGSEILFFAPEIGVHLGVCEFNEMERGRFKPCFKSGSEKFSFGVTHWMPIFPPVTG